MFKRYRQAGGGIYLGFRVGRLYRARSTTAKMNALPSFLLGGGRAYHRKMKDSQRGLMIGAMVLASGLAGFAVGKARGSGIRGYPLPKSEKAPGSRPDAIRTREIEPDPMKAFERLLSGKGEYREIGEVISRIPPAKVPELIARLKETIADTPDGADPKQLREIAESLYFRWAETDPRASWQDAVKWPVEGEQYYPVRGAFSAWLKAEGLTAYQEMRQIKNYAHLGRQLLVRTWNGDDFLENLDRTTDQPERSELFGSYCNYCVEVPEKRDAMLRLLDERKEFARDHHGFNQLFRAWSYLDFDAAMEAAAGRGIEGLQDDIIDATMNVAAEKAMPAAVSRGMKPQPSWESGYENWCYSKPQAAKAWLSGQMQAWNEDGRQGTVANFLSTQLKSDVAKGRAADIEASSRQLSSQWAEWHAKDADAADRWLEGAKPEVKEAIIRKGGSQ